MMDFELKVKTSEKWLEVVLGDFDLFLCDHASCEKKASAMAMTLISHYPDKPLLVNKMLSLAIEELNHYKEVVNIIYNKNLKLTPDVKDSYISNLHKHIDKSPENYLLDRLLLASIIEKRGAERFLMIADGLVDKELLVFYKAIATSEERHYQLFLELANYYYDKAKILLRLNELLDIEAEIITKASLLPQLH